MWTSGEETDKAMAASTICREVEFGLKFNFQEMKDALDYTKIKIKTHGRKLI